MIKGIRVGLFVVMLSTASILLFKCESDFWGNGIVAIGFLIDLWLDTYAFNRDVASDRTDDKRPQGALVAYAIVVVAFILFW